MCFEGWLCQLSDSRCPNCDVKGSSMRPKGYHVAPHLYHVIGILAAQKCHQSPQKQCQAGGEEPP